jgi:hypothetical protein
MAATGRSDGRFAPKQTETVMQTLSGQNVARKSPIASCRHAAVTMAFLASAMPLVFAGPAHAIQHGPYEMDMRYLAPCSSPPDTGVEFDFTGNELAYVSAPVTDDPYTNPFYALYLNGGPLPNPTTVNYVSGQTEYIASSTQALPNPPINWYTQDLYVDPNTGAISYIVGITVERAPSEISVAPTSVHWNPECSHSPVWGNSYVGAFDESKPIFWAAIFTQSKDQSTGDWSFTPYQVSKSGTVKLSIINNSDEPVSIGLVEVQLGFDYPTVSKKCRKDPLGCGGLEKYMDMLNPTNFPISGSGSHFTVEKSPSGPIPSGKSYVYEVNTSTK